MDRSGGVQQEKSSVKELQVLCFESVQVFHTQNKLIRLHFPSGLAVRELEDVWSSFSPVVHLQTHHVVPFSALLSARCVAEENGANHQKFSDVVETPADQSEDSWNLSPDWTNQSTDSNCWTGSSVTVCYYYSQTSCCSSVNHILSSTRHQNQHGANWVRKGSERDERHNESAHTDNCSSGSGSVLWFCGSVVHTKLL